MSVLLVEDEEVIRGLLTEALIDAGFKVINAPDAKTALSLAKAVLGLQLVVSDVNLGLGMDGFALVAAARRRWPTVPVLMMSGMVTNFANRHGSANKRFLLKPFSLGMFLRHVTDLTGTGSQPSGP